jgi:signal transduction histidine kinase
MNNACYAVWHKSQKEIQNYKPEIRVSVAMKESNISITIADNGEGMSDEVKQHLYENFFTTKPIGAGTGLGMSIVRDIIENKHGGKVSFDSTEGVGTTFVFCIPIKK